MTTDMAWALSARRGWPRSCCSTGLAHGLLASRERTPTRSYGFYDGCEWSALNDWLLKSSQFAVHSARLRYNSSLYDYEEDCISLSGAGFAGCGHGACSG